ncbi:MAG: hypothetical protein JWQ98_977 [Chlorobi bacterium]|nr:hypothetical protein [Chlorobiota bacterium]
MKSHTFLPLVVGGFLVGILLAGTSAFAQTNYEEQARSILQIFESGQKDSAYALLEPLKRSARFVPAVLYTRGQMTPDDRALNLYKEVIAIEPGGPWADRAALQLVIRYADKRDSMAAYTWANVLRVNYPRSPLLATADETLKNARGWRLSDEEMADAMAGKKKDDGKKADPKKATPAKTDPKKTDPAKKVDPKKAVDGKGVAKVSSVTPTETYTASGMKGYALQVGLYPTRDLADERSDELKKRNNIHAVALPKLINGKKQYALVIGPYTTIDEANKRKTVISSACNCQTFVVKVQ